MQPPIILGIDDQDDNLALLEALLDAHGFAFHAATDGPSGLALARELKPDLILLDLAMPGMDGFEVLSTMRADPALKALPVIVLTANHRDAEAVERGFALGATEYLTKPIQMDVLLVRIRSTLRLVAAERELARLRRDFASMLVHDMRAPLDGVRLALGSIKRREPAGSPNAELLGLALGSLDDVGHLIEDLLDVNRLEDEGLVAHVEAVDLGALVDTSVRALGPIAEARALALRAEVAPDLPPLQGDPRLLRRVLDNLLANALKFTESGEVVVRGCREDGALRLDVADTGPGIPAAALPHVFDRYFLGERSAGAGRGSFGLGLAFCERAVAAMGGTLSVASVEGEGSTFSVSLPMADP